MKNKKSDLNALTVLVVICFVIVAPFAATARWSVGFLPFIKKLSFGQSFDKFVKSVINLPAR